MKKRTRQQKYNKQKAIEGKNYIKKGVPCVCASGNQGYKPNTCAYLIINVCVRVYVMVSNRLVSVVVSMNVIIFHWDTRSV